MKTLGRLAAGQLNDLERLSMEELSNFVGGSGCVWDCLGKLKTIYDSDPNNNEDSKAEYNYTQTLKQEWSDYLGELGETVGKDGDPTRAQSQLLYNFIQQRFGTTTGSTWGSSDWEGMISSSQNNNHEHGYESFGNALVTINGSGSDLHAVVLRGSAEFDYETNQYYYQCYDPEGKKNKVYANEIQYGTGIGFKDNNQE